MVEFQNMASDTPSQSTRKFTYDVFLSFDTRKNFVDHLYDRLNLKGLHTFKDDERLEKGHQIAPALLLSIQESRFAVVVFSKNYASSPWCLDELTKIMECKDNLNQVVVPIFYDIEPSHVRKQTASFEGAFDEHEENFKDDEGKAKVERWRKALTEAGSIVGHDLHGHEYNGFETECIKAVIADISKQLPPPPIVQKGLVGLELRLEEIRMKLKVWDEDVKLVLGLWGMGGIGKTTIAKVAFDRFSSGFDGSCFLVDVRKHGLEALQKKLLSKVLEENAIDIDDVDEGIQMIKKRLEWKRVLIVLDDIDHRDQLDKLVEDAEWLCNGSRVIITTRDKHLFTQFRVVVEPYEVEKLEVRCLLTVHPNTTTSVIIQVVNDDGALLPCAINATCAALVDAGIPLKHLAVAICCCLAESKYVLLDPDKLEQQKMKAFVYLVFPNSLHSALPKESLQAGGEPM